MTATTADQLSSALSDRYRISRELGTRDGLGQLWLRLPDTEPVLTHPRYPEMLAAMGA